MPLRGKWGYLATATAIAGGIWWRKQHNKQKDFQQPNVEGLLQLPPTAATVTRQDDGRLELAWQYTAAGVHIYQRPLHEPQSPRQLIAQIENVQQLIIDPQPNSQRPLFELEFSDGCKLATAERILPLEGGLNFRDIGGYETSDGRLTRWGTLYRSGDLSRLTDKDRNYLAQLNLQLVCDLRTSEEVGKFANNLPSQPTLRYLHSPIYEYQKRSPYWLWFLLFKRNQIERLWIEEVYIKRFLEQNAPAFGRVLTLMADSNNYPAVIHCTAGKDRTGLAFALLLTILGVPEETIAADYTISNLYYAQILETVQTDAQRLAVMGLKTADLFPLLTAQATVIHQALAHLRQRYGSIENYLIDRAAVAPSTVKALKAQLLEERRCGE